MNDITTRILTRTRTLEFIDSLVNSLNNECLSLYLTPGLSPAKIEINVKLLNIDAESHKKITKTVVRSKTGAVFLRGDQHKYLILPPFPITENSLYHSINKEPLLSLLQTDYKIALILVRLGSYGIGIYQGQELISSKVGTGLVHGRHKKGGSSAHRFERHRDKQIEYFLNRVCQRTQEQLEPYLRSLDYLVYGGARTTVELLRKQCPFVDKLQTETLPPLFDLPEPRQRVLEKAIERVWSSTVVEWVES